MDSISDLLNRLRYFVQAESENQYDSLQRQWSKLLSVRVAKGWAIEGLSVDRIENDLIELSCDTNDSRFREGDLFVLHRGNPQDPNSTHIELQYDGETELEASLIKGNQFFLSENPRGWIADQDWFDASPYYLNALDTVADSLRGRSLILPLLNGKLTPKIDYARYQRASEAVADIGLNESQVDAIAQSYSVDLLHLIQGPPGTGKTLTLAHLAKLLAEVTDSAF